MSGHKFDHSPLLAPGGHIVTLVEIERLCLRRFDGHALQRRQIVFQALEEVVQQLLVVRLPCDVIVDGSFLTEKPLPDDVDVAVIVDNSVMENLTAEQRILIDKINEPNYIANLDGWVVTRYPRGHPWFGSAIDLGNAGEAYGLEHSQLWLKGYCVLRLGETDVGTRICR